MIDTDKYEGHTPAPWNITVSAFKGKYILEEATNPTCANEVCANADLMQDAPLLLAEVKRYKEVVDRVLECALNDNAEQAMQFLLNMDYCLDDEEKVTDKNRHKYTWVNGEWRNEE